MPSNIVSLYIVCKSAILNVKVVKLVLIGISLLELITLGLAQAWVLSASYTLHST